MPSQDGEQNGLMGRVDEGVDEFFSKNVTKMDKSVLIPLYVYILCMIMFTANGV